MNILQRINEVRKDVSFIKKDASVQGYQAVTHDQVTANVRDSLIKNGVVIVPTELESAFIDTLTTTSGGTKIMRFEAKYNIQFFNMDDPAELVDFITTAHALDFGDKAPGKCLSYATKSAILKMFNIETGVNDESRVQVDRNEKDIILETIEVFDEEISLITKALETDDWYEAVETWAKMDNETKAILWKAPTKLKAMGIDAIFTPAERKIINGEAWAKLRREYHEEIAMRQESDNRE